MTRTVMRSGWLVGLALHLAGAGAWADEVLERVVCVVDDDAIFLSELERRARPFLVGIPAGIPPRAHAAQRAEVLRTALDRRIDELLLRRAATRAHITVTEDDIDEFIGRLASERGATPEQVYAALQREGVSLAEYRTYMESELLQLRVLQVRVRGRINVTEADLQQAYRRAVREAAHRTVPTVAHVLIAVAEDATPAQVEAARQRAERVTQLVRAGEDLRSLARQMSDDAESRENGGALGELPPGSLPEALDEAIAPLALGGVTDPVRGPAGWHVIRLASRRALDAPPFASVRERLYAALVNREMLRQRRIYLRELRRTVSIDNRLADFAAPEH